VAEAAEAFGGYQLGRKFLQFRYIEIDWELNR